MRGLSPAERNVMERAVQPMSVRVPTRIDCPIGSPENIAMWQLYRDARTVWQYEAGEFWPVATPAGELALRLDTLARAT